ncbi:MAG TPA: hypothetical protein VMI56_07280 [Reyranella sp.]|nr:hypothetical protein [Reyranella sp.]
MNDDELDRRALRTLQRSIPADRWNPLAQAIADDRRGREAAIASPCSAGALAPLLPELQANGFAKLPVGLPNAAEVRSFLEMHPVYRGPNSDNGGDAMSLETARQSHQMACYRPEVVLRAPGLIDRFNDPSLLALIEDYLGCVPTLYSLNSWWSFPAARPSMPNVQFFHRDNDDWRFVVVFTYLTDVDGESGPHQIVAGSHTVEGLRERAPSSWWKRSSYDVEKSFTAAFGVEFSDEIERVFADSIRSIEGPAGTMFLANTLALHRGLVPRKRPRLLIWARYGLGANANSVDYHFAPVARWSVPTTIPDDARHRYVNRLLFR